MNISQIWQWFLHIEAPCQNYWGIGLNGQLAVCTLPLESINYPCAQRPREQLAIVPNHVHNPDPYAYCIPNPNPDRNSNPAKH